MKAVDAALETLEEKSGKQERLMQKAEEKLTQQKNKVLADDDRDESAVPEPGDEDLLASAEYRSCPEMYGKLWNRPVKKNRHPGL